MSAKLNIKSRTPATSRAIPSRVSPFLRFHYPVVLPPVVGPVWGRVLPCLLTSFCALFQFRALPTRARDADKTNDHATSTGLYNPSMALCGNVCPLSEIGRRLFLLLDSIEFCQRPRTNLCLLGREKPSADREKIE